MSMRLSSTRLALTLAGLMAMPACSSSSETSPENVGGTAGSSNTGNGGSTARGGAQSGGATRGGTANGGTMSGGTSGIATTVAGSTNGGTATGGAPASGGTAAGGSSGASTTTGGVTTVAGSTNGGSATGGVTTTGGAPIGVAGAAGNTTLTGGVATGGATAGGAATGGAPVTVAGNTGQATGGVAGGGAATGGAATGGAATGGAATGGLSGVAGYVSQLPPSCAADPQCGDIGGTGGTGKRTESCCTSIEVPGGTFKRGRGTESCTDCQTGCPAAVRTGDGCGSNETPENSTIISTYKLDKYPVTVGRMKKFLESYETWRVTNPVSGAGANPADPNTGYKTGWSTSGLNLTAGGFATNLSCVSSTGTLGGTPTYTASNSDDFPINCVNWVQAFAFCIWDGGRLPSEAEWEYAAAGGSENRLYPWGAEAPDASRAVFGEANALFSVGSKPAGAGRWGHMDMAGLIFEWVFDIRDDTYYANSPSCDNCINNEIGVGDRVVRGGSYASTVAMGTMRAARRFYRSGYGIPNQNYGFRCAR